MLTTSPARIALHAELAALADAFFASRAAAEPVASVEPVAAVEPVTVTCDGSLGWGSRYSGKRQVVIRLKHGCGPYFAAYVASALRKGFSGSCQSFHFPLAVSSAGAIYGAAQVYPSGPDLPVSHLA